MTRQAYYNRNKLTDRRALRDQLLADEVRKIRQRQPKVGGRKLHKMLMKNFKDTEMQIGRDCFFNLLREKDLLVPKNKNYVRTTYSSHRFRKYGNLIKDIEITGPNQAFASDITYIDTLDGFCYLALITDVYSRKIVGYDLSQSLSIEGSLRALKMALKNVSRLIRDKLIHHSDRGIQYCSHAYVKLLESKGVKISMTEENHVYENALAERVNGILKIEFMLGEKLQSFEVAKELVKESIQIYNNERLHMSIDYQTPNKVHSNG